MARCFQEWFEPCKLVWSSMTAWQWLRWDASVGDDSGAKNISLDFVYKLSWFSTLTVQWTGGGFALQLCSLINQFYLCMTSEISNKVHVGIG